VGVYLEKLIIEAIATYAIGQHILAKTANPDAGPQLADTSPQVCLYCKPLPKRHHLKVIFPYKVIRDNDSFVLVGTILPFHMR